MVSAFPSQSFPPSTLEELPSCALKLAALRNGTVQRSPLAICDLYSRLAQLVSDQTTDGTTPLGLRPPEVVLGGEGNESVDIWTLGCMVSHFIGIRQVSITWLGASPKLFTLLTIIDPC